MPVTIHMPNQTASPLDRIAAAVQMVRGVYGIQADAAALDRAKLEDQDKQEARERLKQNILTPQEQLEYSSKYDISDKAAPGAIAFNSKAGDQIAQRYFIPKDGSKKPTPVDQLSYAKLRGDGYQEVRPDTPGSMLISHLGPRGEVITSALIYKPKGDEAKDPKPDQSKAALFGRRMEQAENVFSELSKSGFDPTSIETGLQTVSFGRLGFPERLKSEPIKKHEQAKRNFINATLRRESGANITPQEFESAEKQYFPQGGDTAEVLAQKAQNRALAIAAMKAESGAAWDKISQPQAPMQQPKKGSFNLIPSAMADQKGAPQAEASDPKVAQYAKQNGLDYNVALGILRKRGYGK